MLGKLFPKERKLRWYDHVAETWAKGDGTLVHVPDGDYRVLGRVYPAEWTRRFVDMPFEGTPLMVSAAYDEMLTRQYGDYMTPPPESKRTAAHAAQRRAE